MMMMMGRIQVTEDDSEIPDPTSASIPSFFVGIHGRHRG